jgi:hypothetical protein
MQQAWSRHFNAVLLAANNGGERSESGSGMYAAGEILASFFDPDKEGTADEKLLIASVPKHMVVVLPSTC